MAGPIIPSALRWHPRLTVLAAAVLALVMAFIAYGRLALRPIG